ncbi:Cdc37 N terminal kinase domain-containing protein [Hamiltosporidium tvaerminnensis]|uniref:Cdc37 N terminal kinase domain-containing protein n=2 Tax=Hamiltosporidium TaxID=1176354 RepID=A0A4Q9LAL8_9MICR|nr:hypothetical protein LUQ84_003307 [Hamiltosporidium tvaerminnensis]TBU04355.1 Cdc37 N terminal kinase domain-containing protein [Hamiltosporidium tvaerminnensis]TBU09602.1 Cdc37 N terminal kinase domain-containing protein [Hamiltosporidium magnivora]TBU20586.1 Cdc37 N terminal kinase domain-containing protein [Hamiltosporidium tvaerminnensis]
MVIDYSKINDIQLSSDSNEEVHPNIDKKSYHRYMKALREQKKEEKRKRIIELDQMISTELSNTKKQEFLEERNKLNEEIQPRIRDVSDNVFSFGTKQKQEIEPEDLLMKLLNMQAMSEFSDIMNNHIVNIEEFEEFVLYNLSENIKIGNDEAGFYLSRIVILIKYLKEHGDRFIAVFTDKFKNQKSQELFDKECQMYYNSAKEAIIRNSNQI